MEKGASTDSKGTTFLMKKGAPTDNKGTAKPTYTVQLIHGDTEDGCAGDVSTQRVPSPPRRGPVSCNKPLLCFRVRSR